MPALLRRNLACFYCGRRSAKKQTGQIRQWQCENCEAVNYLDENGQITDPPAIQTPKAPVQYAHTVSRATSPELGSPDETLFCQACQKNQYLLTQALAEYLPPQNDPKYAEYETSISQYRRSLEERYPQVCVNCAPRVRQRIRAAGYAAKTDHLRRMMQRTKHGSVPSRKVGWGWRNVLVFLGGQAYAISIILSLIWHIFGVFLNPIPEYGMRPAETPGPKICLTQAVRDQEVEQACFSSMIPLAKDGLMLGIFSFWWNNRLNEKVKGSGGRMVGLNTHLKFQVVVLAVRATSIWCLQEVGTIKLALQAFRAAHLFMIIFTVITTFISFRLVKIDHTLNFSFNQTIEPLLPEAPNGQLQNSTPRPPGSSFDTIASSFGSSFPISSLAPAPSTSIQYPPSPTITATESNVSDTETEATATDLYDQDNSMDWTPTRVSPFQPRRAVRSGAQLGQSPQQPQRPQQLGQALPSPFYGVLPPAPKAPAHKISNPFPQPVFKKASLTSQKDFFSKMMVSQGEPKSEGISFGSKANGRPKREMQLGEAKFQLKEEPRDTGLEAMFDSVFSIKDDPAEVRATEMQAKRQGEVEEESRLWAFGQMILVGCLPIAIGAMVVLWKGWY